MELNALVAPLRADIQGGAAEITLRAIDAYEQVLEGARSFRALLDELEQLSLQMIDAQRAMAPLLHLAGRVLEAPVEESELAPARAVTRQALDAFRDELRQAPAGISASARSATLAGAWRSSSRNASSAWRVTARAPLPQYAFPPVFAPRPAAVH